MKKSQQLIGVCIPTYNDGNYLFEAVQSILNQTYKNFIIYILNDGSELKWHNLYKKKFFKNEKIIYLYQKNSGIIKTSRRLLDLCIKNKKINLIAKMDADDLSHPKRFQYQVDLILKNNLDLVGCHFKRMSEKGKIFEENFSPLNNEHLYLHLLTGSPFAHGSIMFRKEILYKGINYISHNKKSFIEPEDYNFYIKCFEKNINFGSVNKFLYFHRYHKKSFSMVHKSLYNKNFTIIQSAFIKNNKPNNFLLNKKYLPHNVYLKIILLKIIFLLKFNLNFKVIFHILSKFKVSDFFKIIRFFFARKINKIICE
jgi:glycosyltransferase involved in cell wall biosynthesis